MTGDWVYPWNGNNGGENYVSEINHYNYGWLIKPLIYDERNALDKW